MSKLDLANLVLEYLKILVWPGVVVAISLLFRKEITTIMARLHKAELPGGFKLDFEEEIGEAKKLSDAVERQPLPEKARTKRSIPLTEANARMLHLGLRPSPSGLDMAYYRDLARQDPNVGLAGLRIEIDVLARNLAQGFEVEIEPRDSGQRLLRKLFEAGAITEEQMSLGQKVLSMCNAAVHGQFVSLREAEAVIGSAQVLADQYLSWLSWGFEDGWRPTESRE